MLTATLSGALGLAGLIVGLIGIAGTALGIAYAKRRPALVFYQEGQLILKGRPEDDLSVSWRGHSIPAFSRTRIWVWNAGTATLDRSMKVPGYPLRFAWTDEHQVDLLSVRTILRSREENGVCVDKDAGHPGSLALDFEYLDPQDGVVFEVEHTASAWRGSASGTLKGTRKTLRERMPKTYFSTPLALAWPAALCMLIPLILILVAVTTKHSSGPLVAFVASLGAIMWIFGYLWSHASRPGPPRRLRGGRDSKLVGERIDPRGLGLPK